MIKYSVVVCTYNRSDYLIRVLNCLKNQTFDNSEFEVVLVNNDSPDNTEQVCIDFQQENTDLNFSYIVEKNKGLSYARNTGIRISKGEWVIFLDDDAEPINEYLSEAEKFLNKFTSCIAAGGRIYPNYESVEPKWMSKYLLPLVSAIDLGNKIKKFPSNKYPIGANMLFKKEVFNKIGHFNVELGRKGNQLLGGEEKEIFMKLREISNEVYYIPDAIVHHFIPDKRIKDDFIKTMAYKIGESNLIIYRGLGINKLRFLEFVKWSASFVFFLYYFLTFRSQKGTMLLKFRFWVLKGILSAK